MNTFVFIKIIREISKNKKYQYEIYLYIYLVIYQYIM